MTNIKHVRGDAVAALISGEVDYLLHQCNSRGVMGSGIAKQIKESIPEAYGVYRKQYTQNRGSTFGMVSIGGGVINMVSQEDYGLEDRRYTNYGVMANIMCSLRDMFYLEGNINTGALKIAIPKLMGCDRGGGDWDIVYELIERCLAPYWGEVIIYELRGGS